MTDLIYDQLHWIDEHVVLTSMQGAQKVEELGKGNIKVVIRLRDPRLSLMVSSEFLEYYHQSRELRQEYDKLNIMVYNIDIEDSPDANIEEAMREALEVIREAKAQKLAVLVHCNMGVSRSVSVCIAYLFLEQLMKGHVWLSGERAYDECYGKIKALRPVAKPNKGFKRFLVGWMNKCLKRVWPLAEESD